MDIGNQQRVIIVELEESTTADPPAPEVEVAAVADLETASTWPLPLDLNREPVS